MAAAIAAVEQGCSVMLVDESAREGGQIYRQPWEGLSVPGVGTMQEKSRKASLLARFAAIRDRIDHRSKTTAHSLFPGPELQIADEFGSERVEAGAVILATGVSERAIPIPGWTLPGVMYAGAMQALFKSTGATIAKRVLIAGVGALPIVVGAQLADNGVNVVAVLLLHPLRKMAADPIGLFQGRHIVLEGLQYRRSLRAKGVPILEGWAPKRIHGEGRVRSVTVAKVCSGGNFVAGRERSFEVDAVGLNFGFTANSELARMAGADCRHDPLVGGWVPVRDHSGMTSVPGIFVAGDGAELRGALVAEAEGYIVGALAAATVAKRTAPDLTLLRRELERNKRFQLAFRRTLRLPEGVWKWADDDTVVCRCEGVTLGRLNRAIGDGHLTLDAIKRNTRCAMGWCGGRTCLQAVAGYIGKPEGEEGLKPMRARPVARPVKLGALANLRDSK
ncbi:MAG: hypothetical protein EOQ49_29290 [Mesorhizobium sp.]|nr:MAG: hypothetical protein EOQ49_29290 [Mesorhizobium sp.]